jgi:hypothetical protein
MEDILTIRPANEDDFSRLHAIEMIWFKAAHPYAKKGEIATRTKGMETILREELDASLKGDNVLILVAEKKCYPFEVIAFTSLKTENGKEIIRPTRSIDTTEGDLAAAHMDEKIEHLNDSHKLPECRVVMMGNTVAEILYRQPVAQPVQKASIPQKPLMISGIESLNDIMKIIGHASQGLQNTLRF